MAETILQDIGLYKNAMLTTLLSSPDICECLLDKDDVTEEECDGLLYSQVFPYLYIDETQYAAKAYICVEVDGAAFPTRMVKDMKVIVWVVCSKKWIPYSRKGYVGTRVDVLSDMIERLVRNSNEYGIGKLYLESVTYLANVNSKYYARQMVFTMPDFKLKREKG